MKYCAFLRGVNVKGTSMKMAEVSTVFTNAGMNDVSSVLATGNIIFSSDEKCSELKVILEKALSEYFNYEAYLFLKTEKDIVEIFEHNPFLKSEDSHIYMFLGIDKIEHLLLEEFNHSIKSENESAVIVNQCLYWKVSKGNTLDSSFGKVLGKKALKEKFTSRNLNTIEKIIKKFNS